MVVLCGDDALQVEDIRSVALEVRQCSRSDGVQTREMYCFIQREELRAVLPRGYGDAKQLMI